MATSEPFLSDVLQDNEDENRLHLFEVYQDEAAVDAHRNAPHYLKWREECADSSSIPTFPAG